MKTLLTLLGVIFVLIIVLGLYWLFRTKSNSAENKTDSDKTVYLNKAGDYKIYEYTLSQTLDNPVSIPWADGVSVTLSNLAKNGTGTLIVPTHISFGGLGCVVMTLEELPQEKLSTETKMKPELFQKYEPGTRFTVGFVEDIDKYVKEKNINPSQSPCWDKYYNLIKLWNSVKSKDIHDFAAGKDNNLDFLLPISMGGRLN